MFSLKNKILLVKIFKNNIKKAHNKMFGIKAKLHLEVKPKSYMHTSEKKPP